MSLDQDVAAARGAVDALERACTQVARHYRDTVDARRLRVDIARLREDLNLLCGAEPTAYARPFTSVSWDDGFDSDMNAPGRTAP